MVKTLLGLLKSKTVWVNVLGGVAQIANNAAGVIPPDVALVIQVAVNIAVRLLTNKPVAAK